MAPWAIFIVSSCYGLVFPVALWAILTYIFFACCHIGTLFILCRFFGPSFLKDLPLTAGSKVFDSFFGGSLGHPDFRQGGDLLKARCLACYLVALRAILASIIMAAFFVSISFCGGSRGNFSSDLGSQFLGGGIGPKKKIVGSTK